VSTEGRPPPQTIIFRPVQTAECSNRGEGHPVPVEVAVQASVAGSYRPPELTKIELALNPPQTIISAPVQTADWAYLAGGAPAAEV
jgi:hypothetical protein